MNKLKVQRTIMPKNSLEYNEWLKEFNFGSAHDLTREKARKHSLNEHYDFSKLISQQTEEFSFKNILELVKFKFL
jgi:hypothetical protein